MAGVVVTGSFTGGAGCSDGAVEGLGLFVGAGLVVAGVVAAGLPVPLVGAAPLSTTPGVAGEVAWAVSGAKSRMSGVSASVGTPSSVSRLTGTCRLPL